MRRRAVLVGLALALVAPAGALGAPAHTSAAPNAAKVFTAKKLIKRFKKATKGDRLTRDTGASWTGVEALKYGRVASQSVIGRYGRFLLYVVRTKEMDADVDRLLADIHTADRIRPNRKGVRWEQNVTLHGDLYWTAKTSYGRNVVLVWNSTGKKGVTKAWKRLNRALLRATR